jgi:large repetitive protein
VPTTVDDGYGTPFNTPLVVPAPGVLTNDNSNGGGAMTAALVTTVAHGSLALASDGGFTYTPTAGFSGVDTFTYRAVGPIGNGNVATVTITVHATTPAPTAQNDSYSTGFNTALPVVAPGVLGNDNSNSGGAMTAALHSTVSNGLLTLQSSGAFTYTPNAGFSGSDSFTYRAVNSGGPSNVATVTITVQSPLPPSSASDPYSTPFETALLVPAPGVLANDITNGGGAMTAALVTNVSHGVLSLGATGGFTYTPDAGFTGVDSFRYEAVNSAGPGNVASVFITVQQPTTVQPPTGLYMSAIAGNLVTLRWTPATLGPPATGFVVEGGIHPGEVLGNLPTGSDPIVTFTAPTGAFYVRVHALSGSDRSGPSNEIRIFVNVSEPPSAPVDLAGLVNGSSLALSWRNTLGGGAPTSLILDVTGSLAGSIPLELTETFSYSDVPAGTYTFSVRAANSAGGSSTSNAVTLTVPGQCSGPPLPSPNFLAYRIEETIYVVWDPAPTGPATTSYWLNVTGFAAFPTTARAMSGPAGTGTYELSLTSVNACGAATTAPQTVVVP